MDIKLEVQIYSWGEYLQMPIDGPSTTHQFYLPFLQLWQFQTSVEEEVWSYCAESLGRI